MEKSSFFNSVNGDRKYKASDFAEFFNSLVTNGIFPNLNTNLQVVTNSNNMTVTVKPGKAWINGYVYINTDNLILNVDVADGVLNRIDRVVIKLDFLNREIKTSIKKGTFASNPVAPELQRDADAYELGVADIYIGKGAISITQSNITDLRMNTNLCGWVNSLIQADTTAIFNQYMDWYNSKKNDYEGWYSSTTNQYQTDMSNMESQFQNDFNTWFNTVKNTLGSDVAGNLLNQINSLAGNGRTTETVKENADAIKRLDEKVVSHSADNTKQFADLKSQDLSKGASLIGIHDSNDNFNSTDVEGALNELAVKPIVDSNKGRYQAKFDLDDAILNNTVLSNNSLSLLQTLSENTGVETGTMSLNSNSVSPIDSGIVIRPRKKLSGVIVRASYAFSNGSYTYDYPGGILIRRLSDLVEVGRIEGQVAPAQEVLVPAILEQGVDYVITSLKNKNNPYGYTTIWQIYKSSITYPITSASVDIVNGYYNGSTNSIAYYFDKVTSCVPALIGTVEKIISPSGIKKWGNISWDEILPTNSSIQCDLVGDFEALYDTSDRSVSDAGGESLTGALGAAITPNRDSKLTVQFVTGIRRLGTISSDLPIKIFKDAARTQQIGSGSFKASDISIIQKEVSTTVTLTEIMKKDVTYYIVFYPDGSGSTSNIYIISIVSSSYNGNYLSITYNSVDSTKTGIKSLQDLSDIDASVYFILKIRWTLSRTNTEISSPVISVFSITWRGISPREGIWEKVSNITLNATANEIDFLNIPKDYKYLKLLISSIGCGLYINFNSDTTSRYAGGYIDEGANWSAGANTNCMSIVSTQDSNALALIEILISNSPNFYKNVRADMSVLNPATSVGGKVTAAWAWKDTMAYITKIALKSPTVFGIGSQFTLWGCK